MRIGARNLGVAAAIFMLAASLAGCASSVSDESVTAAGPCQSVGDQGCAASDNARQMRDAAAYLDEPELGYVKSPPGMLPMPLTSRNSPLN